MSILLKDYVAAVHDKGGIGTEDILDGAIDTAAIKDGAVTADKINTALKSEAIADADTDTEVATINAILAALRKAGIIATSE